MPPKKSMDNEQPMAREQRHVNWLNNQVMSVLVGLVLAVLAIYIALLSVNAYREGKTIGKADVGRDTVTITGEGRVKVSPDKAIINITIRTEDDEASVAQQDNVEQFNELVAAMKAYGIADEDLQTRNYNVYPIYDWVEGQRVDRGYEVYQTLEVTIRDVENAGDVVEVASEHGVNEISGLQFTVDDPEQYRGEARRKALENAKEKAEELASTLGVRLGDIVSFSESSQGGGGPVPMYRDLAIQEGMGGGGEAVPAPRFEAGSEEIVIFATVIYEVN